MVQIFQIDMTRPGDGAQARQARHGAESGGRGDAFRDTLKSSSAEQQTDSHRSASETRPAKSGPRDQDRSSAGQPEETTAKRGDNPAASETPEAIPGHARTEGTSAASVEKGEKAVLAHPAAKTKPGEHTETAARAGAEPSPGETKAASEAAGKAAAQATDVPQGGKTAIAPAQSTLAGDQADTAAARAVSTKTNTAEAGAAQQKAGSAPAQNTQHTEAAQLAASTAQAAGRSGAQATSKTTNASGDTQEAAAAQGGDRVKPSKAEVPAKQSETAARKAESPAMGAQASNVQKTAEAESGKASAITGQPLEKTAARGRTDTRETPATGKASITAPEKLNADDAPADLAHRKASRDIKLADFSAATPGTASGDDVIKLAGTQAAMDGDQSALQSLAGAQPAPQAVQTQAASPHLAQAMRAQTLVASTPGEIADIIQTKLASNDSPDRVVVQLDPPELGRVSIDFKFDAQGLQHITVTGETPEALKHIRQLHFHLTQALEQHGLSGQDMSFQQQFAQQNQKQGFQPSFSAYADAGEDGVAYPDMSTLAQREPVRIMSAGLDLKL